MEAYAIGDRWTESRTRTTSAAARALIASRPLAVWIERFAGADCCVTPVLGAHEALFGRGAMTRDEGMQRLAALAVTLR